MRSPIDRFVPLSHACESNLFGHQNGKATLTYRVSKNAVLKFSEHNYKVEDPKKALRDATEQLREYAKLHKQILRAGYPVTITLGVAHFTLPQDTWFANKGQIVAGHLTEYCDAIHALELPLNSSRNAHVKNEYQKLVEKIQLDASFDLNLNPNDLSKVLCLRDDRQIRIYDVSKFLKRS